MRAKLAFSAAASLLAFSGTASAEFGGPPDEGQRLVVGGRALGHGRHGGYRVPSPSESPVRDGYGYGHDSMYRPGPFFGTTGQDSFRGLGFFR